MKKLAFTVLIICLGLSINLGAQSFNFKVGIFSPKLDSDLWQINMENLAFDKNDLRSTYFSLEYEQFLGKNLSITFEGGYYQKDHYSMYSDYVDINDDPIFQNLALEMFSVEAGVKFYPLGNRSRFSPYVGGGAGMYFWKYEQWGDFIDFTTDTILENQYLETSTSTLGFNVKGGFVFLFTRSFGFMAEARYQVIKGSLSSFFEGFEKLDLTGLTVLAGFCLRF